MLVSVGGQSITYGGQEIDYGPISEPTSISVTGGSFGITATAYVSGNAMLFITAPSVVTQPSDESFNATSEYVAIIAGQQFTVTHTGAAQNTQYRAWLQVYSGGVRITTSVLVTTVIVTQLIATDTQALSASALIELFTIDMSNIAGGSIYHFHSGANQLAQPIVWQGVSYTPLPIEATGFDKAVQGTLPRPTLTVANVDGIFSALVYANDDLVGCKVTRKQTFAKYLDAVNFPNSINLSADPTLYFPDEVWYVDQKVTENKYIVSWDLASAFDLQGVMLPYRQVLENSCSAKYRGPECGYTGTNYFNGNDFPCSLALDVCAKRLTSCKVRFGTATLPFGGYPGAVRYA